MNTDDPKPIGSLAQEFAAKWGLEYAPRPKLSPDEEERRDAEKTRQFLREQRLQRFRSVCPPRFQEKIDRSQISNLVAWDISDEWTGSFPGVWLWSKDTGEAKTRMLWRKFGQFHVESGKTVLRMTGQAMAEEYFRRHMDGEPGMFYSMLTGCQVCMLDDLDKMDLEQDRIGRMLRESFDRFYEKNHPILVTANKPISWFEEKIGKSCARRMREVCREVEF